MYTKQETLTDLDLDAALELVISLAEQNIISKFDNPKEYRRQSKAVELIKETFNVSS